jgi:peptidoglycan/LPS O-acetylase OafA/YrhL
MNNASVPSRIRALDGLRGLLALVVLAWHVATPFGAFRGDAWLLMAANVAVALFFVMSGLVLTRAWDGHYAVFLIRRFFRLWPVYAFCLALGYAVAGVHPLWSEFFWYPFMGPNDRPAIDPPVWSLFLEAWAMIFMPLIVWAGTGGLRRAMLCIVALAAVGLLEPKLGVLGLFVAGAYLSAGVYRNRFLESALPQWLGKVSYSLYLVHFPLLAMAVRIWGPWGGFAALPAVFAASWLLWRTLEHPSIRFSRWLAHRL